MTESTIKITIERTPAEVFDFVLDPKHTPDWISFLAHEETNEWPPRVGTIYRNRNQAGKWHELKLEEFEPPRMFVLGDVDGPYHVRYTVEPAGQAGAELTYHEWVDEGELTEAFDIKHLEKLKEILER